MSAEQAIAFMLFAVAAAITPGPSNLILTATGAAVGVLRGLPTLFGQVVGMGLMLFLVAAGLGSLVVRHDLIVQGLKWCGIAFLLWLAWKTATAGHHEQTVSGAQVGFWGAAAFQWINPKAWLVCIGAAGAYIEADSSALGGGISIAALFVLVALPSCFLWLAAGASVQRLLRTPRAARAFNLTMAALLAASVVLFVL